LLAYIVMVSGMYPKIELSWQEIGLEQRNLNKRLRERLQQRHVISSAWVNSVLASAADWRHIAMAKSKQQGGKEYEKAAFKGFFNYDLKSDEKDEAKAFLKQDEEIALSIENAISSGFKLSVAANKANGTVIATMTAQDPALPQAGYSLSAHARHWYDALGVLMFKHYKVLGQKWHPKELEDTDGIG